MKNTMHRRQVVEALLKDRGDLLVVAGLGSTAWDITAAGDSDLSFPLWGAMGNAAMFGLVAWLLDGFRVAGFMSALLGWLVVSAVTWLASAFTKD